MKPVRQFFTTSPEHADRIGQGIAVRVTNFADSAARRQRFPRRQIAPLVAAQSLFQCGMSVDLTLTGLVGYRIAPTPALATVPFAAITLGAAVMSAPASFCVRKWGYRKAFLLGASAATLGGILSAGAISFHSFSLFTLGTFAVGVYQGFANYYRYAAADGVPAPQRGRAISTVLTGGVVAAVAGPLFATAAKDVLPAEFAGSYVLVSALAVSSGAILMLWRSDVKADPTELNSEDERAEVRQPRFAEIARRPIFLVGVGGTALGYFTMMLLMTAAPIAAVNRHHTIEQGAFIVQWHMVGMFAPSLFSGRLIRRLGTTTVLSAGIVMSAAASVIDMLGTTQLHFMVALLLVGVGWNFMYVSGTTFIAGSYSRHERARVQASGELLTMSGSAVGALSAGALLSELGWTRINALVLVPLLVCTGFVVHYIRTSRRQRASS